MKVKELTEFNEVTPEAIERAHTFLKKQIDIVDAKPSDINSVIFTSGTSGRPKAVIDSHTNVISGGACLGRQFVPYHFADSGKQSSFLSYLPLAHVFERDMEHLGTFKGQLIYYSSGTVRNLTKDLSLAKPTIMIGVPRVYCKIYQGVMDKLAKQGKLV